MSAWIEYLNADRQVLQDFKLFLTSAIKRCAAAESMTYTLPEIMEHRGKRLAYEHMLNVLDRKKRSKVAATSYKSRAGLSANVSEDIDTSHALKLKTGGQWYAG